MSLFPIITHDHELQELCTRWSHVPALAIDTEFIRTDTFYPIPALIQIHDGEQCYLLDPTALSTSDALTQLLVNPSVTKVLHSCSEDLEVFERLYATLPSPLFDTQVAAALLGYGFSAGYSKLVKTMLGHDLPKDESRSNWLQRPLRPEQIDYAARDVIYLYELYQRLDKELVTNDKQEWFKNCMDDMLEQYAFNQKPEHYYQRIKNSWRLNDTQRQLLFESCYWREAEARRRNKPRGRIVKDEQLFDYARQGKYPPGYYDVGGRPEQLPPQADKPLPKEAGELMNRIKMAVDDLAERYNLASEMLARKKDITAYVSSGVYHGRFEWPASLHAWRRSILDKDIIRITDEWRTEHS